MAGIIYIEGRRSAYGPEDLLDRTMTVRELIEYLEQYEDDSPVMLRNDNGYTYGHIDYNSFSEQEEEQEEEWEE